jgi:hypothetical protein
MLLDVPYRRVADVDTRRLERVVERLAVMHDPLTAPLWSAIAARMEFIGKDDRPADVGYRKMRPTGYVQLCIVNDEEPRSPWAVDVPQHVLSAEEQAAIVREYTELCTRLYGPGTLFFLVFAVLAPGGIIPMHKDMAHDQNKKLFSHHLHVPITGAADTEFTLKGTAVRFQVGGAYEIDNISPHGVVHHGAGFRVNLMLDYCPAADLHKRNAPSPKVG